MDTTKTEAVNEYLKSQLDCYKYWCVAGPGGSGWNASHKYPEDRKGYEEIRDWLNDEMRDGERKTSATTTDAL